jgi:hypothetical protein
VRDGLWCCFCCEHVSDDGEVVGCAAVHMHAQKGALSVHAGREYSSI